MLEDVKAAVEKIKEDADLMAREQKRRSADEARKDEQIDELQAKLRRQRREIEELEEACGKLKSKIGAAEGKHDCGLHCKEHVHKKPVSPRKLSQAEPRALAAAIAIALLGSILWIFTD